MIVSEEDLNGKCEARNAKCREVLRCCGKCYVSSKVLHVFGQLRERTYRDFSVDIYDFASSATSVYNFELKCVIRMVALFENIRQTILL